MESYEILSRFYDRFLLGEADYKSYSKFIMNEFNKLNIKSHSYLDLACGTGNLSIEIAKNFLKTTCMDISENMLSIAYNKFLDEKINANFIQSDISNFVFNDKFSLITCGLDSLNYLLDEKDVLNCFKCIYDVLCDGGLFVFDVNSFYKIQNVFGNNTFIFDEDDIFCAWENEYEDEIVDMHLTFFIREIGGYKRYEEDHAERAYEIDKLASLLKLANFKDIKYYDDYTYDDIHENSERVTFVSRKQV